MSAKKAANLFRIYCFMCRCGAAGYSVSMLSVKPELEQAFNQLCSDVVLHIRVVIAVHLREVADISSVSVKDGLYRYGVALMCLYDSVIGEKSVTHGTAPPFPLLAASRQAVYAPDCAACPAALFSDFFLRQVLKVVQKDFFLRLFRQSGKSSRKRTAI